MKKINLKEKKKLNPMFTFVLGMALTATTVFAATGIFASDVGFSPVSGLTSTNVQAAIDEVYAETVDYENYKTDLKKLKEESACYGALGVGSFESETVGSKAFELFRRYNVSEIAFKVNYDRNKLTNYFIFPSSDDEFYIDYTLQDVKVPGILTPKRYTYTGSSNSSASTGDKLSTIVRIKDVPITLVDKNNVNSNVDFVADLKYYNRSGYTLPEPFSQTIRFEFENIRWGGQSVTSNTTYAGMPLYGPDSVLERHDSLWFKFSFINDTEADYGGCGFTEGK